MPGRGRGERVMRERDLAGFRIALEERETAHPAERVTRPDRAGRAARRFRAAAGRRCRGASRARSPTNRIASPVSAHRLARATAATVASPRNLTIGPFAPSAASVMYARPFAPNDLGDFGERVEIAPRERRAAGIAQRDHAVARRFGVSVWNSWKSLPRNVRRRRRVRARTAGRACRCRSAESPLRSVSCWICARSRWPSAVCHTSRIAAFHHRDHVVFVDERHLDVELGELRLTVGARILVAETARDLHVAADAADHQNCLSNLRRLRQRVEMCRDETRLRHEVVARAFGRRLDEDRRLDLDEIVRVEVVAHRLDDAVPHASGCSACAGGAGRDSGIAAARFRRRRRRSDTTNGGVSERVDEFELAPPVLRSRRSRASGSPYPAGARRTRPRTRTTNSLRSVSATRERRRRRPDRT